MRKPNDRSGQEDGRQKAEYIRVRVEAADRKTTPESSRQKEKRLTRSSAWRQQLDAVDAGGCGGGRRLRGWVKEDGGWFISGCRPSVGSSLSSERSGKSPRFVASTSNGLCGCNPSVFKLQGASARLEASSRQVLSTTADQSYRRASHSDRPTRHRCRRVAVVTTWPM